MSSKLDSKVARKVVVQPMTSMTGGATAWHHHVLVVFQSFHVLEVRCEHLFVALCHANLRVVEVVVEHLPADSCSSHDCLCSRRVVLYHEHHKSVDVGNRILISRLLVDLDEHVLRVFLVQVFVARNHRVVVVVMLLVGRFVRYEPMAVVIFCLYVVLISM
eukprot:6483585-Amphidinium_carterae.3